MKKITRFLGVSLVGVAGLLLAQNAQAVCGGSLSFGQYYSLLDGSTATSSLRSSFWILNNGNPTLGPGMDNGAVADSGNWLIPYGSSFAVQSNWNAQLYDGCPDPAVPPAAQAQIVAFSDVDGSGNMVYAVMCSGRDTQRGQEFLYDFPSGCGGGTCSPITLQPAPKAMIAGTTRAAGQANITVASPNFAPGYYSDGSPNCAINGVIPQYDVYKQELARGAAAPTNADATGGWTFVGTGNTGSPFMFTTTCVGDCDVYVATLPAYNSNFKTGEPATGAANRVGPPSTRVQSGPILANPPKPRIANPRKAGE
jgi:hypothetical protein